MITRIHQMNFQVPQFIEVEDKIFGPLSFRQFLYIAGSAGLAYMIYNLSFIPLFLRLVPTLGAIGLGLALAFYKVNSRPLIYAIESAFWYYTHSRLYLWKKENAKTPVRTSSVQPTKQGIALKKLSDSRLKDLSWSLDVNEKIK